VDEVDALFSKHRENSTEFSREMVRMLNAKFHANPQVAAQVNLELAKTVFSKWSIEILTLLYSARSASYGDLKRELQGITSKVLSEKLKNSSREGWLGGRQWPGSLRASCIRSRRTASLSPSWGSPSFSFWDTKKGSMHRPRRYSRKPVSSQGDQVPSVQTQVTRVQGDKL
jgi:hypothetical protein